MNGDFGASLEVDTDQGQQEPSVPSPAMRHCAPTKQPLKSESGKHWSKSKREVLGGPSTPKPKAPIDSPAKAESGSKKVNMQSIYEKKISYKYLPLELASATTVKNSIAKNILFQSLGHGLLVIKYGRQGGPKKRILYCDFGVTKLFWSNSLLSAEQAHEVGIDNMIDESKTVSIADITEVRAGTDLDPDTTMKALQIAAKAGVQAAVTMLQKREAAIKAGKESKPTEKRKSLVGSLFGGHEKDEDLLYGTATLRKKAKPEEFSQCLSLITNDRTIDIQCFSKKDYNLLYINLKEIVNKLRNPTTIPDNVAPAIADFKEGLSTKKSVRFMMDEDCKDDSPCASPAPKTPANPSGAGLGPHSPAPPSSSSSFALTEASSGRSLGEVYHLNDDDNMDMLLAPSYAKPTGETLTGKHQPGLGALNPMRSPGRTPGKPVLRTTSMESDSGHNPATFSDAREAREEQRSLARTMSSLSGLTLATPDEEEESDIDGAGRANQRPFSREEDSTKGPFRMKAHEALQIGLILSQQEQEFGTNMYQALTPEDEPEIERLNSMGFSTEEAILKIFKRKYQPDQCQDDEEEHHTPAEEANFDYGDEFARGESFKGSIKTIFGRQSSFFPQVFHATSSETESRVSNLTEKSSNKLATGSNGSNNGSNKSSNEERHESPQRPAPSGIASARPPNPALKQPAPSPAPADRRQQDMMQPAPSPDGKEPRSPQPLLRLSSCDALQIGLLLSQQEEEFGVNMYDSLENSDESTIRRLVQQGYSNDEAVLEIFNMKFGKTGPKTKWSQVSPAAAVTGRLQPAPAPVQYDYPPPPQRLQAPPSYGQGPPPPGYPGQSPQYPPQYPPQHAPQHQQYPPHASQYAPQHAPQYPSPQYPHEDYPSPYPSQGPPGPGTQYNNNNYAPSPQYHQPPLSQYDMRPPPINTQPTARPGFQRTNSLAQSSFFPNDPHTMSCGPGPGYQQQQSGMLSPRSNARNNVLTTLSDEEAVHMALLLSQQEAEFGVNMYDALRPTDERELQSLIATGYTNEQAVLCLFEKRYPPRGAQPTPPAYQQAPYSSPMQAGGWSGGPPPQQMMPQQRFSGEQYPEPNSYMSPPGSGAQRPGGPPQRQASMMVPPRPSPGQGQGQGPQFSPAPQPQGQGRPTPATGPAGAIAVVAEAIPVGDGDDDDGTVVTVQAEVALGVSRPKGGAAPMTSSAPAPVPAALPSRPMPVPVTARGGPAQQVMAATGRVVPPPEARRDAPASSPAGPARTSSMASVTSTASTAAAPASGEKPKLVKKRSIFNFGGGSSAEEPREKLKYREADVRMITKMGYTKDQAVWALLQSHNNVPHAIDMLCNS